MDIQIVDAKSSDVYDNWRIQRSCWLHNFPNFGLSITEHDILDWFDDSKESNKTKLKERAESVNKNPTIQHLWVAKDDEKIVGFAAAKKGERNEVDAMFVLPEYQKRGIGGKLMNRILEWIGNDQEIYLNVVPNNINAVGFYKRYGFIETDKEVDSGVLFASGANLPNIEMVKKE
jgi:GNAT superfamily N-acetyltransferase